MGEVIEKTIKNWYRSDFFYVPLSCLSKVYREWVESGLNCITYYKMLIVFVIDETSEITSKWSKGDDRKKLESPRISLKV